MIPPLGPSHSTRPKYVIVRVIISLRDTTLFVSFMYPEPGQDMCLEII